MGINVALTRDELPVPNATSLALEGMPTDVEPLVASVLGHFERYYRSWSLRVASATSMSGSAPPSGPSSPWWSTRPVPCAASAGGRRVRAPRRRHPGRAGDLRRRRCGARQTRAMTHATLGAWLSTRTNWGVTRRS
ncbi:hypothetical protein G7085_16575 [Tessaracoccus sp. HDW20]|nr:hypothetical protein [Tessaracoccus coleopterorum]NHB85665.1 hypothetical protein [Tessaracoccus coleopterorum]